jgi:hypothetical protein
MIIIKNEKSKGDLFCYSLMGHMETMRVYQDPVWMTVVNEN